MSPSVISKLRIIVISGFFILQFASLSLAEKKGSYSGQQNIMSPTIPVSSPRCNQFTFDATNSHDPDKENLSYFWDFGDGKTSTDPIAEHIYNNSGDYMVSLSITDSSGLECSTAAAKQLVRVNIPPFASFTGADYICTDQIVTFDASASRDDSSKKLSYYWDFGDGTKVANKKEVLKSYSKGGSYRVTLRVNDNTGAVCSDADVSHIIKVNAPPVADAGVESILKCISDERDLTVDFTAANSTDPNGDPLTVQWDFGDGTVKEGTKVSHTYKSAGNYDAKLIVKDQTKLGCSTAVDFVSVRLNKAPIADAGDDILACTGENVLFDGSKSYSPTQGVLDADWNFGDGTSSKGIKTFHKFIKPGQYQATLTITNKLNSMCPASRDTKLITVNSSPSVKLTAPKSACLGTTVQFDATNAIDSDGDTLEYYWSFGDGTILRAGPKVNHDYKQGGNYRVSVIVDDGQSSACSTATTETMIRINTPPVADPGANLSCCVNQSSMFDASASFDPDNDHLSFYWDFGNGQKAKGPIVDYSYPNSGKYNVTLTVDDNSGTACSKSTSGFTAEVNTSPIPVINIR